MTNNVNERENLVNPGFFLYIQTDEKLCQLRPMIFNYRLTSIVDINVVSNKLIKKSTDNFLTHQR
jgi:hypothetical protein